MSKKDKIDCIISAVGTGIIAAIYGIGMAIIYREDIREFIEERKEKRKRKGFIKVDGFGQ